MNIVDAPKTGTFQMRINPEVKKQVESLYAKCGMTLTDAVNAFFQQSLNVGGLPFIKAGEDSVKSESDWISEEDMLIEFGVQA